MAAALSQDRPLPELREDLQLLPSTAGADGSSTWTLFDPIRNRYFQIGWPAFQLLSRWAAGKADRLVAQVVEETTCQVSREDVDELIRFLYANSLTERSATGEVGAYVAQANARRQNMMKWMVHNYLFFRIPLVRPHSFLKATLAFVEPLFTGRAMGIVATLGLIGIYLAMRQWDSFVSTFLHFFSLEGAVLYGVALVFVKILHELGHGYTATRFGCKVPTMGVAFLVMFPVLYTDATDAWRLTSRRQRLLIGAAGMMTELGIALLATFAWSFLPDGPLRSVAFILATTGWITTLMVNLNPFMRFDGYYIMSDWLGVQNLQTRAFAFGRWQLRRMLFGLKLPAPEPVSASLRRKLIVYSWGTWLYRFFLFLGIAILVYYLFFKALGLLLFIVEILWFIVFPILNELRAWWQLRGEVATSARFYLTLALLGAGVAASIVPWSSRVAVPALLSPASHSSVFAPAPGQVDSVLVKAGDRVTEQQVLLRLKSTFLDSQIVQTRKRIELLDLRARRQAANPEDLADTQVLLQQLATQSRALEGLEEQREKLVIRSPMTGIVTDVAEALHVGRWVNPKLRLAYIVQPESLELKGVIAERELDRLEVGQPARFYPDSADRQPLDARLVEIGQADEKSLQILYLASIFGGGVAVSQETDRLVPQDAVYRVRFDLDGDVAVPEQAVRGTINVRGRRESFARRFYEVAASVLIRESGF